MGFSDSAKLTLIAGAHPVLRVAARELTRQWEAQGGRVVRVSRPNQHAGGPRVALRLASYICPTVLVRFAMPYSGERALRSARRALTSVAWEGFGSPEPWRALAAPLNGMSHRGRPNLQQPWAVAHGSSRRPLPQVRRGYQLHLVGGPSPNGSGAVRWPATPAAVAAVLGRADCAIGCRDPLCYDAMRLGVPVLGIADRRAPDPEWPDLDLAGLVLAPLLTDGRLWSHVAEVAAQVHARQQAPEPLLTLDWIGMGREGLRQRASIPPPVWRKVQRKYKKLRRDPGRFFADSPHALVRALGELRTERTAS